MTRQKTILVTGATGGIGHAVCHKLAQSGYSLLLAARDEQKLKTLANELSDIGPGSVKIVSVDMSKEESVASFAKYMLSSGIELDGAVMMPPQIPPTNECLPEPSTWRDIFQNSFIGPLSLLKAAIACMNPDPINGKRAKIVIISGISSAQVLGHYATSNVLRCAWLAEAKTLAFALGDRGIHVNTLSLGGTLTPGYTASLEKRAENAGVDFLHRLAEETANVPLKKYGKPEEVATAVEGLLSSFSDHMTGINILHDGGFTRSY
ncbi:MAG: SDR family oxidoreductase [Pseudomonadota bacterium]